MTRAELQALAERYLETWKRRDPVSIADLHAVDGVVESPIYATLRGRKAVEDSFRAFFTSFPDATLEADAIIIDPPHGATFTTINATHKNEFFGMPGTNRRIEFRTARLVRWDEQGLIEHERRIYDFTGLLVQLGVLRAKPGKPL